MRWTSILCCLVASACAAQTSAPGSEGSFDPIAELGPGGAADESGLVVEVALGTAREGAIAAYPGRDLDAAARTIEDLAGYVHVYRLAVEPGQPFAVLVEPLSGDIEPYILAYPRDADKASVHGQGILPMAEEEAALFVTTAESNDYVFFVGDRLHDDAGSYRVRFLALQMHSEVDVNLRSGEEPWSGRRISVQAVTQRLRDREPQLGEMLLDGRLAETEAGWITSDTPYFEVSGRLRQRAEARGVAAAINEYRGALFQYHLPPETQPNDPRYAHVGEVAADLWRAVRAMGS